MQFALSESIFVKSEHFSLVSAIDGRSCDMSTESLDSRAREDAPFLGSNSENTFLWKPTYVTDATTDEFI
jgi:hypothetical protein